MWFSPVLPRGVIRTSFGFAISLLFPLNHRLYLKTHPCHSMQSQWIFTAGCHSLDIECNTAFVCFSLKHGHAQQLPHSHPLAELEDTKVGQKVSLMLFNLYFYSCFQGTCKHPAWHTVEYNKRILNQYCKWQMRFRATLSYFHLGHRTGVECCCLSLTLWEVCQDQDQGPMANVFVAGKVGSQKSFPNTFPLKP